MNDYLGHKVLSIRLEKLLELRQLLRPRYANLEVPSTTNDESLQQEDAFLKEVRSVILENLDDENFHVPELCKAIGMSRSQLYRKIKALTNTTTTRFIRAIRIKKAQQLLKTTQLNVTEVAFEVGFKDPNYFTRIFSEVVGTSPSTYVKT